MSSVSGVIIIICPLQHEDADERRDPELGSDGEAAGLEARDPRATRMKVQHARAEGQEVRPVAQVLGDDDAAAGRQDPVQLREERAARWVRAQFVRGEQQQCGIG